MKNKNHFIILLNDKITNSNINYKYNNAKFHKDKTRLGNNLELYTSAPN